MADFEAIGLALQKGKAADVKTMVQAAVDEGCNIESILQKGLIDSMKIIGDKMQKGEVYVPEVLIAARAMNAGLTILEPLLEAQGIEPKGTIIIATVKGDLHDIGKNLAAMMYKGAGFKVVDLGVDAGSDKFLAACKEHNPDVIGLSALLTTTMVNMEPIIKDLREAGYKGIIQVGGAPLTQAFADKIGADLYADDASTGVQLSLSKLGK